MDNPSDVKKRKLGLFILSLEGEESSDDEMELLEPLLRRNDDDEEVILRLLSSARAKRNCVRNYVEEIVPTYTEKEFRTHFRVNKNIFEYITNRFENHHLYEDLRCDKRLPALKTILMFLWFAGHEACSFRDIADRFDVCIATVNRVISRVTMFLSDMAEEIITWPDSQRMEETSAYFHDKYGCPKIIGAIDGTYIIIDPPKKGKDDYIDRKGETSSCLQGICDEKRKFIDIFVGYPGSAHDSRVFTNSFIFPKLDALCKDYCILGDLAYPLLKNLLTSYKDNGHLTLAQKHYNTKLSSCRVVIEHSFGMLKQRFRQLYYCKLRGMEKLCHFVRACCVLHNLASDTDFDFAEPQEDESEEIIAGQDGSNNPSLAKSLRDSICAQMWELHEA